jgi:multidrug efflux pump subunit AcrA (membrane-fusion protein)
VPWSLLLDLRVLLGIALIATGVYAKVQTVRMEEAKAEYAQFRADVESEAAKAKVAAAQESLRQAQAAQEVLSDLQTRYAALNARYGRLRASSGSGPVPSLSAAAPSLGSCPDGADAAARLLAEVESLVIPILEEGDRELAKYGELWELQQKNSLRGL